MEVWRRRKNASNVNSLWTTAYMSARTLSVLQSGICITFPRYAHWSLVLTGLLVYTSVSRSPFIAVFSFFLCVCVCLGTIRMMMIANTYRTQRARYSAKDKLPMEYHLANLQCTCAHRGTSSDIPFAIFLHILLNALLWHIIRMRAHDTPVVWPFLHETSFFSELS